MRKRFKSMDWFTRVSVVWLFLMAFFAIFGRLLPLPDPLFSDFEGLGVGLFSPGHILGADTNGYDLLANVVVGAQTSLLIALVSVGLGGLIGAVLGIIAAYRRGRLD